MYIYKDYSIEKVGNSGFLEHENQLYISIIAILPFLI